MLVHNKMQRKARGKRRQVRAGGVVYLVDGSIDGSIN